MLLRLCTMLCASLLLPILASAEEKPWTEVRSPHFRVLTDGTPRQARDVAAEFEQMRYVFSDRFAGFRLESGAPLTIFAARDVDTAKQLEPALWKHSDRLAGVFHRGWEKQFAVVRMDTWGNGAHEVVYHEYTHSILHLNAHWLPVWLDEGLAEFYAYTRFQSNKIYVGAPTERAAILRSHPLLPVETMLDVNARSPYYTKDMESQIFYADAWALVHYLAFGPNMQGGALLNKFFNRIQGGTPQKQAFVETFGDMASFDKGWNLYMNRLAWSAGVLPAPPPLDEKSYGVRKLSVAETEVNLGAFHIATNDAAGGAPLIDAALGSDPALGIAHEEHAFLLFRQGKDPEALTEFNKAFSLDSTLYRSLFAATMLSPEAKASTPAEAVAYRTHLQQVIAINPSFAPAFVEMAKLAIREHDYQTAHDDAHKAESLEPFRAGYYLLTGRILLAEGRGPEAAQFAKYVADHWVGPDHDEAVELWNKVPPAQRPAGIALAMQPFADHAQSITGIIQSTQCGTATSPYKVELRIDGTLRIFSPLHGMASGFSDTLWYGEDHFNFCHHLQGKRALVFYQPGADPSAPANLLDFEIRDDDDAPVASAPATPAVAAN